MKKLLFILAVLSASSAACAGTLPLTWTFQSSDAANTSASGSGGSLDLSVYKNNWVLATADLGSLSGSVTISFDYTTVMDGWWEHPFASISTGGAGAISVEGCAKASDLYAGNCPQAQNVYAHGYYDIAIWVGATRTGAISRTFDVSGPTTIGFGIVPSDFATNGDHANTYFHLRNITASSVPEPTPLGLMLGGVAMLLGIGRWKSYRSVA